mgnify:CR=1 FL=1
MLEMGYVPVRAVDWMRQDKALRERNLSGFIPRVE